MEKDLYDDWDIPNPLGHYAKVNTMVSCMGRMQKNI